MRRFANPGPRTGHDGPDPGVRHLAFVVRDGDRDHVEGGDGEGLDRERRTQSAYLRERAQLHGGVVEGARTAGHRAVQRVRRHRIHARETQHRG